MGTPRRRLMVVAAVLAMAAHPGLAQETSDGAGPDDITVLFGSGNASIAADERDKLDQAARLFRDGNPIIMIVTGNADTVGDPEQNLDLSIRRARAVADGLAARGIPIGRLQVLGQGNSELPTDTEDEVPNAENRSARITWR